MTTFLIDIKEKLQEAFSKTVLPAPSVEKPHCFLVREYDSIQSDHAALSALAHLALGNFLSLNISNSLFSLDVERQSVDALFLTSCLAAYAIDTTTTATSTTSTTINHSTDSLAVAIDSALSDSPFVMVDAPHVNFTPKSRILRKMPFSMAAQIVDFIRANASHSPAVPSDASSKAATPKVTAPRLARFFIADHDVIFDNSMELNTVDDAIDSELPVDPRLSALALCCATLDAADSVAYFFDITTCSRMMQDLAEYRAVSDSTVTFDSTATIDATLDAVDTVKYFFDTTASTRDLIQDSVECHASPLASLAEYCSTIGDTADSCCSSSEHLKAARIKVQESVDAAVSLKLFLECRKDGGKYRKVSKKPVLCTIIEQDLINSVPPSCEPSAKYVELVW